MPDRPLGVGAGAIGVGRAAAVPAGARPFRAMTRQ
jgi:hypothetical protein